MAKREIPLFIIDTSRRHKKGDCDFVFCTDKDNAFVAKIEFLSGNIDEVGQDYRIASNGQGHSLKISVARYYGANVDPSNIKSLLKRAVEYYFNISTSVVNVSKPSKEDCIRYLELLIKSNMHNLDCAKSDFEKRQTIINSMLMLKASAEYISKLP